MFFNNVKMQNLRPIHTRHFGTILRYCNKKIFWYQSIEFYWTTKVSSEQNTTQGMLCFYNSLPWLSLKSMAQKYLFIAIFCLVVNKAKGWQIWFFHFLTSSLRLTLKDELFLPILTIPHYLLVTYFNVNLTLMSVPGTSTSSTASWLEPFCLIPRPLAMESNLVPVHWSWSVLYFFGFKSKWTSIERLWGR